MSRSDEKRRSSKSLSKNSEISDWENSEMKETKKEGYSENLILSLLKTLDYNSLLDYAIKLSKENPRSRTLDNFVKMHRNQNKKPIIFVKNLPRDIEEKDIEKEFYRFGELKTVVIIKDAITKVSRGFGFVTFEDLRSAEKVIENFDTIHVNKCKVEVSYARDERPMRRRRSASMDGGRDRSPFRRRPPPYLQDGASFRQPSSQQYQPRFLLVPSGAAFCLRLGSPSFVCFPPSFRRLLACSGARRRGFSPTSRPDELSFSRLFLSSCRSHVYCSQRARVFREPSAYNGREVRREALKDVEGKSPAAAAYRNRDYDDLYRDYATKEESLGGRDRAGREDEREYGGRDARRRGRRFSEGRDGRDRARREVKRAPLNKWEGNVRSKRATYRGESFKDGGFRADDHFGRRRQNNDK